jgi:hypothetical protein
MKKYLANCKAAIFVLFMLALGAILMFAIAMSFAGLFDPAIPLFMSPIGIGVAILVGGALLTILDIA